jgi:hypothetical protein
MCCVSLPSALIFFAPSVLKSCSLPGKPVIAENLVRP